MAIRTELNLRLANSPGALSGVFALLSDERVNILAMALEGAGQLRLVVDNHVHGAAVLREHHHQVTERDVIVMAVANSPGALAPTLRLRSRAGGKRGVRLRRRRRRQRERDGRYRCRRCPASGGGGRGLTHIAEASL